MTQWPPTCADLRLLDVVNKVQITDISFQENVSEALNEVLDLLMLDLILSILTWSKRHEGSLLIFLIAGCVSWQHITKSLKS